MEESETKIYGGRNNLKWSDAYIQICSPQPGQLKNRMVQPVQVNSTIFSRKLRSTETRINTTYVQAVQARNSSPGQAKRRQRKRFRQYVQAVQDILILVAYNLEILDYRGISWETPGQPGQPFVQPVQVISTIKTREIGAEA